MTLFMVNDFSYRHLGGKGHWAAFCLYYALLGGWELCVLFSIPFMQMDMRGASYYFNAILLCTNWNQVHRCVRVN